MKKTIIFMAISIIAVACGVNHKVTGGTDNNVDGTAIARVEIAFPTCEKATTDEALVECVKAASTLVVDIVSTLTPEQIERLEELGVDLDQLQPQPEEN